MKRILGAVLGLAGISILAMSCAATTSDQDEGVGAISYGLSKCSGGKLSDSNYCSATCKCNLGEGDCDNTTECNVDPTYGQLLCNGHTAYFHLGTKDSNACTPAHCINKKKDVDETQVDCGGSCGSFCPNACAGLPADGTTLHCTTSCRCPALQGDCDANDLECTVGNYCAQNVGNSFGFGSTVDVCLANSCKNGVQDGDELGLDCGPSCLPCSGGSTLTFGRGGAGPDHGLAVAIDSSAAIVIAGRFGGTSNFGGTALTASGGSDIFVARYNNAGAHSFSKRFGGSRADGDLGVAVGVDSGRNVYIAGNYRGTIDFGGAGFTHTTTTTSNAFVVKLTSAGVPVWSRSYGGGTTATRINGMTVTAAGDVFVAGAFSNATIQFGANPVLTNAGAVGVYDGFVAKINTSGTPVWSRRFGGTGLDNASSVALDAALTPYVSGSFVGTAEGLTSTGGQDGILLKLVPATGATAWARKIGGTNNDLATSLAVDSSGPVVGGQFKETVTFAPAKTATAAGANGAYVVAYDAAGNFRWHKAYVSTGSDRTLTMVGTTAGVVALGDYGGSIDFGGGGGLEPATAQDMWAVRYNVAGTVLWTSTTPGDTSTSPLGAALTSGILGITGDFKGAVDFGSGSETTSNGATDAFFTRLVY